MFCNDENDGTKAYIGYVLLSLILNFKHERILRNNFSAFPLFVSLDGVIQIQVQPIEQCVKFNIYMWVVVVSICE